MTSSQASCSLIKRTLSSTRETLKISQGRRTSESKFPMLMAVPASSAWIEATNQARTNNPKRKNCLIHLTKLLKESWLGKSLLKIWPTTTCYLWPELKLLIQNLILSQLISKWASRWRMEAIMCWLCISEELKNPLENTLLNYRLSAKQLARDIGHAKSFRKWERTSTKRKSKHHLTRSKALEIQSG